jgi:hypothetical protein
MISKQKSVKSDGRTKLQTGSETVRDWDYVEMAEGLNGEEEEKRKTSRIAGDGKYFRRSVQKKRDTD